MSRTIVLIHGAWHGAWAFDAVVEPLRERGFTVVTIDLPLAGVAGDVAAARTLIEAHPGAVVLGHSYGGLVITHAALDLDVSHLVYLAAMMPDQGEDVAESIAAAPQTSLQDAMALQDDGRIVVAEGPGIEAFYDDCEPGEAQRAVARLRPMLMDGFPVLERAPVLRDIASTYEICNHDKALHPDLQRTLAERAARMDCRRDRRKPDHRRQRQ